MNRSFFTYLVFVSILALSLWFVVSYWQEFSQIATVGYVGICLVAVLFLFSRICVVFSLVAITRHLGTRLRFHEAYQIDMATTFLNYMLSKAGLLVRAVYLNKNHSFSYANYSSLLIAMSLLQLFACGSLGICFSSFLLRINEGSYIITFVFFLLCLFCVVLTFIPRFITPLFLQKKNWLAINIFRVLSACEILYKDKKLLLILTSWTILGSLFIGLRLYVCYWLLDYNTPWVAVFIMAMAAIASRTVSIVPGGLGIREFVIGIVGVGLGNNFEIGVVAATLDRIGVLIVVGLLGSISFLSLYSKRMSENKGL